MDHNDQGIAKEIAREDRGVNEIEFENPVVEKRWRGRGAGRKKFTRTRVFLYSVEKT